MDQEEVLRPEEINELCRNLILLDIVCNLWSAKGSFQQKLQKVKGGALDLCNYHSDVSSVQCM